MPTEPHITIVGGGFSGAAVAIHLLDLMPEGVRVTLLEPRAVPGAGVAYSTAEPSHRINVPASRMQLAGEEEGAFDRWYRSQPAFADDPQAWREDGSLYPQRGQFGRYVSQRFAEAVRVSAGRLVHLREQALTFDESGITTESGRRLQSDLLILAVSHPPPALPRLAAPFHDHPALIANPWRADSLTAIAPDARVAVMGTGLTMADCIATLSRLGHRGPITAFSRHGLLSRGNVSSAAAQWPGEYRHGTLRQRLAYIRRDIRRAAEQGLPWQVVLDAVRSQGQAIWQQMSEAEKRQFLRHLRRFWDVHRYRIAPQVSQAIAARQRAGLLRVQAARLNAVTAQGDALRLQLQPRGGQPQSETVDYLVLTTGPAHSQLISSQPFFRALEQAGMIRADALGMGIEVDAQSQPVGSTLPIWVAGPAARGRFGELMGLPQVADHAQRVAQSVLERLDCRQLALS